MPIYAYRCTVCGHAKDVLQRMSDPLLSVCPACGASSFEKQVTAAGFQLKGSGWYVTDFKGGAKPPAAGDGAAETAKPDAPAPGADTAKADPPKADAPKADAASGASAAKSATPPAPAAGAKAGAPVPSPTPKPAPPATGAK